MVEVYVQHGRGGSRRQSQGQRRGVRRQGTEPTEPDTGAGPWVVGSSRRSQSRIGTPEGTEQREPEVRSGGANEGEAT